MTIKLTPDVIRAAYDYLNATDPFLKWNLPDSDDLSFAVASDKNNHGWLTTRRGKRPRLTISRAVVGHTLSLITTVAHEMIHLHQYLTGMPQTHGPAFDRLKARVCKIHGFDPKAF